MGRHFCLHVSACETTRGPAGHIWCGSGCHAPLCALSCVLHSLHGGATVRPRTGVVLLLSFSLATDAAPRAAHTRPGRRPAPLGRCPKRSTRFTRISVSHNRARFARVQTSTCTREGKARARRRQHTSRSEVQLSLRATWGGPRHIACSAPPARASCPCAMRVCHVGRRHLPSSIGRGHVPSSMSHSSVMTSLYACRFVGSVRIL